jgi:hypothetical protein
MVAKHVDEVVLLLMLREAISSQGKSAKLAFSSDKQDDVLDSKENC